MDLPEEITPHTAYALAKELRSQFNDAHGNDDAFNKHYYKSFNELEIMRRDDFNRSAQPILVLYFLAFALEKHSFIQGRLAQAFREEASKPWKGKDDKLEFDPDAILTAARDYIRENNLQHATPPDAPEIAA